MSDDLGRVTYNSNDGFRLDDYGPAFKNLKAYIEWYAWYTQEWQGTPMKRYTIELRFDDEDDPQKAKAIASVLKQQARTLFTSALMVSGRRKPSIAIHTDDHFMKQEIVLNEDNNGEM